MPRQPLTIAEARQLRRLIRKAGFDHLLPLLPQPHKRGRHPYAADAYQLRGVELFLRTAMRERGMRRNTGLHWIYDPLYKKLLKRRDDDPASALLVAQLGPNTNAVVARISKKLREGGFHKLSISELLPPEWLKAGIDPERFTTLPPTKTD
jgi:hypothetical protein